MEAVRTRVILRLRNLRRWSAFETWYYNVWFSRKVSAIRSKVAARWQSQACRTAFLFWHEFMSHMLRRQLDCQRVSTALELVYRRNFLYLEKHKGKGILVSMCLHQWVLYAQLCVGSAVSASKGYRHKAQLLLQRMLSKWSIVSISKQVDIWEPMLRRSDLSVRSPEQKQQIGSLVHKSPSDLSVSLKARDDEDVDCIQRALLSSYQRLEHERLRRRVVLSWASAITCQRK